MTGQWLRVVSDLPVLLALRLFGSGRHGELREFLFESVAVFRIVADVTARNAAPKLGNGDGED